MRTHTLLLEHFNFTTQAAQLQTRDKRKGDERSILEKELDLQVTEEGQALCLVLEQNLGPPDCLLQARLYSNKQFVVRNSMKKKIRFQREMMENMIYVGMNSGNVGFGHIMMEFKYLVY